MTSTPAPTADSPTRFAICLPRSFPEPLQDELSVELYRGDEPDDHDPPSIMVAIAEAIGRSYFFALSPDEARAFAAHLVLLAGEVDAGRWPEPGEPGV